MYNHIIDCKWSWLQSLLNVSDWVSEIEKDQRKRRIDVFGHILRKRMWKNNIEINLIKSHMTDSVAGERATIVYSCIMNETLRRPRRNEPNNRERRWKKATTYKKSYNTITLSEVLLCCQLQMNFLVALFCYLLLSLSVDIEYSSSSAIAIQSFSHILISRSFLFLSCGILLVAISFRLVDCYCHRNCFACFSILGFCCFRFICPNRSDLKVMHMILSFLNWISNLLHQKTLCR